MSFILDAIAKSEQERQQQQAPDARSLAFPAAVPARSRGAAPYLLAGSLLLGSVLLAAVWLQPQRSVEPTPGGSGDAALPAVPGTTDQPRAPVESPAAPPPAPAVAPEPVSATPMLADSAPAQTVARVQPSAVAEPAAAPVVEPAIETPASEIDAGAPQAAAATPPSTGASPRRRVSRLSELPVDVRRVLPSVVFTGHLYSKNPRASYVFIDGGRQVVAGQQITDDLLLDEITPTGVVVEFQGYLIEVGVLQNWSLK